MTEPDIVICGAGPVGLALAALLARRGVDPRRILLVDGKPLEESRRDPRSIALSWGSRQILEQVHAFPAQADPILDIHVSRRGHFGRTLMTAGEHGLPALGYVSRYGALVSALAGVVAQAGIASLRPVKVTACTEQDERVALQLDDGRSLVAKIAVQAEGGLFGEQAAGTRARDYGQTAVVAQVTASAPPPGRAYERFTGEGPLALLPQEGGYALVWCMRPERAAVVAGLPDGAFLAQLQEAFGMRAGRFTAAGPRFSYPLGLNARPGLTPRTVAIGNAAQTLHPVAGQGLNLGLRDADVLARLLARDASPDALHRFTLARQADRGLTIRLTDTLARLFASAPDGAASQSLLGLSLGLMDALPPAKRLLADQMMFGRR